MDSTGNRCLTIGPLSRDHLHLAVFKVTPPEDEDDGVFKILIDLRCEGFSASGCGCWIQLCEFEDFLSALRQFETSRTGTVRLISLHGDFELIITSDHPSHWPTITGQISGNFHAGHLRSQLQFVFKLDSGLIPTILKSAGKLLKNF